VISARAFALAAALTPQGQVETILYNGKIITLAHPPIVEALAVAGGRVLAVGTSADVRRLASSATDLIDLGGRSVVPGLSDNHYHGIGGGPGVDLSTARRLADVLAAIRERARRTPAGDVIVTNSDWHEGQLVEQRMPYRDELDRAAPQHAVVVVRGGHEYVLNSAALERWNITPQTPQPPGGKIGRYPDGRLNGELVDRARSLVALPAPTRRAPDSIAAALTEEYRRLNAQGLTSIRYAGGSIAQYRELQEMRQRGQLTLRVNFLFRLPAVATPANLDSILAAWTVRPDEGDEWLRIGGIKFSVDGGFEGGWMREPYEEPWGENGTFRGLRTVDPEWYREAVRALNRRGWRVATHAVGDAGIDLVLDAYEAANRERPISDRRWAIEHAFVTAPDQLPRIKALGLAISAQHHLYVAAPSLERYWGRDRAERVTPVRTYLDAGLSVSSGTDSPVIPENPFWTLYHFATRGTISAGVVGAEQRVSRIEALALATVGYAHLTFEEHQKGSLGQGKVADLVVLSDDLLTCTDERLEQMAVMLTMVGGRVVYRTDAW
jgi:predicted amidohydrolase YtcJ